jgi:Leucine-rich repeat (LRR) protein
VNLKRLDLSHNILHGSIPVQISSCSKLYSLDLSFNSLNGSALSTVSNLKFLTQL